MTEPIVVAYGFYWEAFVSVWCFFAALLSTMLFVHYARFRVPTPRSHPIDA